MKSRCRNLCLLTLSLLSITVRADQPVALASPAKAGDYAQSIATWRSERVGRLTTPNGWLSLIGRHQLAAGNNSVGTAPDNSIILAAGPPYLGTVLLQDGKVSLTPAPHALYAVDGQPATQPAELVYKGEKPTTVTFGSANLRDATRR